MHEPGRALHPKAHLFEELARRSKARRADDSAELARLNCRAF